MTSNKKYFFVGLSRTGNQTAINAMKLLGFKSINFPMDIRLVDHYETLADTSVAYWFKCGLLDTYGNDSIFVFLERDLVEWLDDCQEWFESRPLDTLDKLTKRVRKSLYGGSISYDRNRFADAYLEYRDLFLDHFKEHPQHAGYIVNLVAFAKADAEDEGSRCWDFFQKITGRSGHHHPFPFTIGSSERRNWNDFQ